MWHTTVKNVFWIIPFASFIFGYLAMEYFAGTHRIETPAIVGKSVHEAVRMLSANHLTLQIIEERDVEDLPEGTIIQQMPNANAHIKPRQSVFCVISQKTVPTTPAIVGKLVSNDINELSQSGTTLRQYNMDSIHPVGTIIAQSPSPGEPLIQGNITAYVAKTKTPTVVVPVLTNHPVSDIQAFVETYPVNLEIMHGDTVPETHQCDTNCLVIDQRPRAGTLVALDPKNPINLEIFVKQNS